MAQSIFKPRDNGRIGLPQVNPGMNRIAPNFKPPDDKGGMLGAPTGDKQKEQKLMARILKRMERAISAESENRRDALDDLNFKAGKQWPSDIQAQRNLDKRPCLTINKLPTFVHQITNDLRQNRPSINISPVGDRSDPEVAKMYRGLIRAIERDCFADVAYDTGIDSAVSCGFGYWRILTEYEAPDSFNQVIVVRRIRNPFTVYMDPNHIEPDGSDARWCFISEMMARSDYEDKYPDADPLSFQQAGMGDNLKDWITKDQVRVAEYYELTHEPRDLVFLSNGHQGWEDELDEVTLAYIERGRIEITDRRTSDEPKIKYYKVNAIEVLEEHEWLGKWIPVVKVIGDEIDIEGKVRYSGVIRNAKDAQRMFNFWRTLETEMIALQPKAPWIVEEGQIEGHEDEWRMANIRNQPYLSYKGTSVAGKAAPPPQRQQMAGAPAGVEAAIQGAAQDMMATTGVRFDATMNERMIDESGKAIRELRRTGDIGSFHYADNAARSLRHTGEIFVDLIPKIYDAKRIVTILREDDSEERVHIDPALGHPMVERRTPDGKVQKVFNPTYGKYGVTVTIGPSYATKRIEASENMIAFARAMPQTAALIADLIAKNQDWPGADEIAARLAKTLPPQLLMPEQKDMSPQVQALIQAMDGQIKKLGAELQKAMVALNDKSQDRAVKMEEINKRFEASIAKVVIDMETKLAKVEQDAISNFNTHIGAQLKDLGEKTTMLMQSLEHPRVAGDGKELA